MIGRLLALRRDPRRTRAMMKSHPRHETVRNIFRQTLYSETPRSLTARSFQAFASGNVRRHQQNSGARVCVLSDQHSFHIFSTEACQVFSKSYSQVHTNSTGRFYPIRDKIACVDDFGLGSAPDEQCREFGIHGSPIRQVT
jgi:hypothetical protein